MFKKRLLTALAVAGLSFGTLQALSLSGLTFNSASAVECTGGGSESFTNIPASSSAYSTRNWTGDNGVAWSATDARTDQTLTGKAIAMRTGTLKNTTAVAGGVGTLSFDYKRVFTGNSTLKVFVNGVQYGGDITVSSETPATFSQAINVAGNVTIEIKNSGNRVIVDNISWTCSEGSAPAPEVQIVDASNNNHDCGAYTLNFGSHPTGQYQDAVFSVKNTGSATLNVSALSLSNTTDFTIISPSVPFSVTAGGSAIVLVRFDAATGGEKNSVLTIVNNDANESECTVNLTGIGMEACTTPVVDEASTIAVDSITSSSANVTIGNVTADYFLAVVTTTGSLSSLPADTVNYAVNDSIGGGVVVYIGSDSNFTLPGLDDETEYSLYVFPYNNINCTGGPLYNATGLKALLSTPVAPCLGGNETFAGMPANSSAYLTRTWTGDNNIEWFATDARTDQTLTDRAIAIRTGSLTNTVPVSGGIDTLSFDYKRVFTGNSTLKVFVNGVQYGGDITVSSDTPTTFTQAIEIEGDVTIEIENSGNRTIIDNISWNCYSAPDRPEIQVLDENQALKACGDTIDMGDIDISSSGEAIITIKNNGLQNLEISSITVDDTVNYTIVDPVGPITIPALSSYDLIVSLNSTTTGSKPAVITINSNDADEAVCNINLTANVLASCVAPEASSGDISVSNQTSSSVDVALEGITAGGYIAIVTAGGTITAPSNGTIYEVNDTIGDGAVAYTGTSSSFTIENLNPETTYTIFVYAYNATDCIGGPAYSSALETAGTTTAAPCVGGAETFSNMPANSSAYATRTWTGDNGVEWTATDARTDQQLTNRAVAIRLGNITNTTPVSGGIGTLSFNYKRVFSGNSTLKVFVNGVQYGGDIAVTSETPANFTQAINVTGDVTVEIENAGNRVVIDDITWDCYSDISARPAAQPVKSSEVSNEIKLYPNPSNGQFQLDLVTETADVAVYNTIGKEVLRKTVSDNETIDLGKVEAGIYMVVITSGNNVSTQKVVIK